MAANREPLFGISEAARRVGVAEGTLRTYDKRGIIHPQRDYAGRRLFTQHDVKRARQYRDQILSK